MTEHKNIYVALAAAQAEFSAPKKGAVNPAFRSKYADLASVVEAVAPALSSHGIAFFHHVVGEGDALMMRTALWHGPSETHVACDVPLIVSKRDMQGFKSATTYAKRIGLESVTGVAPEDDDGNAAAKAAPARADTVTRQTVPDERFETEDGVVSTRKAPALPADASPVQRARAAADGILAEFETVKRRDGFEGVWTRNEGVIKRLQASYPEIFNDVADASSRAARRLGIVPAEDDLPIPAEAGHP